jgi:hypothetical protein
MTPKQHQSARSGVALLVIVVSVLTLYLWTNHPEHDWGGDFSMYVSHARNLSEGLPYAQTSYIPPPGVIPGPSSYPPAHPILLLPAYALYGLQYDKLKIIGFFCFVLSLWMIHKTARTVLSESYALLLVTAIGFSPYFFQFKENVLSDVPFLFFTYLALVLILNQPFTSSRPREQFLWGVSIGIAMYVAYATRSIGAILLPALILNDLISYRRVTTVTIIGSVVFVFFFAAQNLLLRSEQFYIQVLTLNPDVLVANLFVYLKSFSILWKTGAYELIRIIVFIFFSILAAVGFLLRVKQKITILELFFVMYFLPLVLFSVGEYTQQRYLIPLLPLYLMYAFYACQKLTIQNSIVRKIKPLVVCLSLIVIVYSLRYANLGESTFARGVTSPDAADLFTWVQTNTEQHDVILFGKPRVLSLYTSRPTTSHHGHESAEAFWKYAMDLEAQYVIAPRDEMKPEIDEVRPEFFDQLIRAHMHQLALVHENTSFRVYRIIGG